MGWVKLDDGFFTDAAVLIAGPAATSLYLAGLCHASRNLTDGRIDRRVLPAIAGLVGADQGDALLLVELGLWVEEGSHYNIPNYLRFNPSRDKVLADRAAALARMHQRRSGEQTPNNGRSSERPSRPVPDDSSSSLRDPRPNPQGGDDDEVPEEVWTQYAALKRSRSAKPVNNPGPWDKRVIANGKNELGEKALRWWTRFDISTSELAEALAADAPSRHWQERKKAS